MPPNALPAPTPTASTTPTPKANGSSGTTKRSSSRVLGDYTLSKSLGQGSMGKVKLAHHNITHQKVCVFRGR
jgi:serine/threonine protein kinase